MREMRVKRETEAISRPRLRFVGMIVPPKEAGR